MRVHNLPPLARTLIYFRCFKGIFRIIEIKREHGHIPEVAESQVRYFAIRRICFGLASHAATPELTAGLGDVGEAWHHLTR